MTKAADGKKQASGVPFGKNCSSHDAPGPKACAGGGHPDILGFFGEFQLRPVVLYTQRALQHTYMHQRICNTDACDIIMHINTKECVLSCTYGEE